MKALTVGAFDALHIAHQHIIKLISKFEESALVTFDIPPKSYLTADPYLFSLNERLFLLKNFLKTLEIEGLTPPKIVVLEFPRVKNFSAEQFLAKLRKIFYFEVLVAGEDFSVGRKVRRGNFERIKTWCMAKNVSLIKMKAIKRNKNRVSTSLIKTLLMKAKLEEATKLLGRPYSVSYTVVRGKGLGKKIGFPTANAKISPDRFLPPEGVYLSKTIIEGRRNLYDSLTFIGKSFPYRENPSFETHILNFSEDIYEQRITVLLIKRLRDNIRFSSKDELKTVLENDVKMATNLHKTSFIPEQQLSFFL